jgi:hypothetical protein
MTRFDTLLGLTLAIGACSPSTHSTAFQQVPPKSSATEVAVFTEAVPDRPYVEIGVIEVSASELSSSRYGDLIQRARLRAADMGADAIIVTRDPQTHTSAFAYVPRARRKSGQLISASSRTDETPRIQVAAITWKSE